jgi:hypothetical protein
MFVAVSRVYSKMMAKKDSAAVSLGRRGGKARASAHSPEELSQAGTTAVNARWAAYYKQYPDKLKAKLEREKKAAKKTAGKATK